MPAVLGPILHSGIVLASVTAILLNLFLDPRATSGEGVSA
jgi:NCS2 family nucleobase:cation symporter-2